MDNAKASDAKQVVSSNPMGNIESYFKKFNIGSTLNKCGVRKLKGISPLKITMSIFALPFIGLNFFRGLVQGEREAFQKDAAYNLLNPTTLFFILAGLSI